MRRAARGLRDDCSGVYEVCDAEYRSCSADFHEILGTCIDYEPEKSELNFGSSA